ncbi:MAG: DEAD/DEAH box helicase [Saprospiraceae bacterium]|nr:DEAD/DEAH box helicase [Saprospiraceae bacterium]
MNFTELGLDEKLLEAISYMGFEKASPIQELAIPEIMKGRDLIACAQTGTGKTAAFMLPILHNIVTRQHKGTSTLVIVPTRELAVQIEQQIQGFAYFMPVSSMAVYGGGSGNEWEVQRKGLEGQADIIVATPGKLLSFLNMGKTRFETLRYLILDEADRMLDMGFYDDIKKILAFLPKKRQTLMFSATMPTKMKELAKSNLIDPAEITIAISKPSEAVLQAAYLVNDQHKAALINDLIKNKPTFESIIVFCSTKKSVQEVTRALSGKGYTVEGISSDLEQKEREEMLNRFRAKNTRVIVATDVLARGIDIKDINLVINYNVPNDGEDYVHRIGRTARADASGVALTLINEHEMGNFADIEKLIGATITKINLPPQIGISPEWDPNARHKRFSRPKSGNSSGPKTGQKSGGNRPFKRREKN